ncbi:UNVERIFIED_CONTAM: hypothetical protein Sradi_5742100 [Sesamum radiatum]|uniref:Tf2-1-like SH3-like domain-containing protein n=1 Tax=Sesamum radiatum TaxID=300843 RepID=A0AAW2L3L6_SESRA
MKTQADRRQSEWEFAVGDWVFVKLKPYKQMSLAPRYFGPLQVVQRIGAVAYKLELPEFARIHPVFHVSQLNKKVSSAMSTTHLPVTLTAHGHVVLEPKVVLDRRLNRKNNHPSRRFSSNGSMPLLKIARGRTYMISSPGFHTLVLEDKDCFGGGNCNKARGKVAIITKKRRKTIALL